MAHKYVMKCIEHDKWLASYTAEGSKIDVGMTKSEASAMRIDSFRQAAVLAEEIYLTTSMEFSIQIADEIPF